MLPQQPRQTASLTSRNRIGVRARLTQIAANVGMWVVAVDPAFPTPRNGAADCCLQPSDSIITTSISARFGVFYPALLVA